MQEEWCVVQLLRIMSPHNMLNSILLVHSVSLFSNGFFLAYPPRRTTSAKDRAEAMFKSVTSKPVEVAAKSKQHTIPAGKETVSLRIDRDVLEHFQDDGPGWQDRINAALRKVAGLD